MAFHPAAVRQLPLLFALALASANASSSSLDAKEAGGLVSNRTWQATRGANPTYWQWKSDGALCLRLHGKSGDCDDTGTWNLDGNRLCYQLTWWGKANGLMASCFRISPLGKGKYEAVQDSGISVYRFEVDE